MKLIKVKCKDAQIQKFILQNGRRLALLSISGDSYVMEREHKKIAKRDAKIVADKLNGIIHVYERNSKAAGASVFEIDHFDNTRRSYAEELEYEHKIVQEFEKLGYQVVSQFPSIYF